MHRLVGNRARKGGYVLVAFSLALLLTLGALGLTFDIGRMYITRGEARSFSDAAAIAAALQLDGTNAGITRAKNAALGTVKGWEFGTKRFNAASATIQVTFGKISGGQCGEFTASPEDPAGYICARVSVSDIHVPMFLMPVLINAFTSTITARATAAQIAVPGPGAGNYSPFSPFAHTTLDPASAPYWSGEYQPSYPDDPFNLKAAKEDPQTPGGLYSLLWPNTSQLNVADPNKVCKGDADLGRMAVKASSGSDNRGYIYNESNVVTDTILASIMPAGHNPINSGDLIGTDYYLSSHGNMHNNIINSLADRVRQDSDSTSQSYWEYVNGGAGNGKRIIVVPINAGPCGSISYADNGQGGSTYNGNNTCQITTYADETHTTTVTKTYQPYQVIGWARFFLLDADYYDNRKGNDNACAEYIGPGNVEGGGNGSGSSNIFEVRLVE